MSHVVPIPASYHCPITHEVFIDPVTTCDGQTYERDAITEWFARTQPPRSPLTNLELPSTVLAPNTALKSGIQAFLDMRPDLKFVRSKVCLKDVKAIVASYQDEAARAKGGLREELERVRAENAELKRKLRLAEANNDGPCICWHSCAGGSSGSNNVSTDMEENDVVSEDSSVGERVVEEMSVEDDVPAEFAGFPRCPEEVSEDQFRRLGSHYYGSRRIVRTWGSRPARWSVEEWRRLSVGIVAELERHCGQCLFRFTNVSCEGVWFILRNPVPSQDESDTRIALKNWARQDFRKEVDVYIY